MQVHGYGRGKYLTRLVRRAGFRKTPASITLSQPEQAIVSFADVATGSAIQRRIVAAMIPQIQSELFRDQFVRPACSKIKNGNARDLRASTK
jgi:hypothetical protein